MNWKKDPERLEGCIRSVVSDSSNVVCRTYYLGSISGGWGALPLLPVSSMILSACSGVVGWWGWGWNGLSRWEGMEVWKEERQLAS